MSSDDDDGLVRFGTALDPIEEDEVPAKKITLADQIVVDSNGKRRFHGAFTGGFAAGYWNTVGSKEGWTPSEFKSSRHEKASERIQRPSDFMDEEDVGEFGIAPQRIQTTDDYGPAESQSKSKRKLRPSAGSIPGVPVLELVLESFRDKAAVRLLKRMDEKYAKQFLTKMKQKKEPVDSANEVEIEVEKESEDVVEENCEEIPQPPGDPHSEAKRIYQCDMGPIQRLPVTKPDSDSDDDMDDTDIVFEEDEFDAIFRNMKIDRFGLSYMGLEKGNFFSIVGAEAPVRQNKPLSSFTMLDKNNKSVTIRGQAFGVGAFEEDDDDIYGRDDMTKYDFHSGNQIQKRKTKQDLQSMPTGFIDGFQKSSLSMVQGQQKKVFRVQMPSSFEPRNWIKRKSRFGPEVIPSTSNESTEKIVGRHDMTPEQRGSLLNQQKTKDANTEPDLVWVVPVEAEVKHTEKTESIENPFRPKQFVIPENIPNIFDRFTAPSESKSDVANEPMTPNDPPPTVPQKPKEVKRVVRTRLPWEAVQLLCYKMNIEAAIGSKPKKPNAFSLFECINVGSIAKRSKAPEFEKSSHNDDTEIAEIEKINERSKEIANLSKATPSLIPQIVKPVQKIIPQFMKPNTADIAKQDSESIKPVIRSIKPKTELEKKAADAMDEHPSKKIDLFKAIFDSDSESDDDTNANSDTLAESTKEFIASLGKPMVASATPTLRAHLPDNPFAPKSAKELNILRNTSPPRGIFRSLIDTNDLMAKARAAEAEQKERQIRQNEVSTIEDDAYGPSLPPPNKPNVNSKGDDRHATASTSYTQRLDSQIHFDDEWVERSRPSERSSKKSKKEKKEHKHKKAKHKDKREKHKKKKRHS